MHKTKSPENDIELILIKKVQAGDKRAFHDLFITYHKRVFAVAYKIMGHHDQAEDVTQEVFVKIFKSISKYNVRRSFFTYLYKITVNVCFDRLKKDKRNSMVSINSVEEQFNNLADEFKDNPHRKMEQKELDRIIRLLMQRLGPKQRTAFILRDVEGLDAKEVADILKCSRATVRSHLHFARKSLRDMIATEYPEFQEN